MVIWMMRIRINDGDIDDDYSILFKIDVKYIDKELYFEGQVIITDGDGNVVDDTSIFSFCFLMHLL